MKLRTWLVQGRALLLAAVTVLAVEAEEVLAQETFTDPRDGQIYRTVKIGNRRWLAQNLNYKTEASWCYEKNESKCRQYGRLYWSNGANKACPSGWHLATSAEWDDLSKAVGGKRKGSGKDGFWYDKGDKLKSSKGWGEYFNGTDEYGFAALPGGYRDGDDSFTGEGKVGFWWTDDGHGYYEGRIMEGFSDDVSVANAGRFGWSVRCVGD
jgi:uncharacterized protein (TIGR02145 family)